MQFECILTSQTLSPMTKVTILRIFGDVPTETKEILMRATPNVKTLLIEENEMILDNSRVSIDFGAIANVLPKIQYFALLICRITHHDLLHSLDVAITGLPEKFCKKYSWKFRNRDSLTAEELNLYQLERRSSSILDLKVTIM